MIRERPRIVRGRFVCYNKISTMKEETEDAYKDHPYHHDARRDR